MRPLFWFLPVLVLIATPLTGCTLQTGEDAFHIDGRVHEVMVETATGDVRLVAGANSDVHVEAQMAWSGERPEVLVDYRGGVLYLSSPCLDRDRSCEVSFVVTVPASVRGEVRTVSGDIELDGDFESVNTLTEKGAVKSL